MEYLHLRDVRESSCSRRELIKQLGRWHSVLCVTAEPVPVADGGAAFQAMSCLAVENTDSVAILTLSPWENSSFGSSCILDFCL